MSLEVVETRLILLEDCLGLLLGQDCRGLGWMFSEPDLSSRQFTFPSAVNTSFALISFAWSSVLNVCDKNVSFPYSPHSRHIREIFQVKLSDRNGEVLPGLWQKWGVHRIAVREVLSHQTRDLLNVSQTAATLHGLHPPFFIQT